MKPVPLLMVLLLLFADPVLADIELADVNVPDRVTARDGTELTLNGAGIRRKYLFPIYVGALYLTSRVDDGDSALALDGPKRMDMHFVHSEVERDKIIAGWNKGFRNNHSDAAFSALEPRLRQFNQWFTDARGGDHIVLEYLPERGTRVVINGTTKGEITGRDFNHALLRVWLGDKPVTDDLKADLLGASR